MLVKYLEHEEFHEAAAHRKQVGPKPLYHERYARTLKCLILVDPIARAEPGNRTELNRVPNLEASRPKLDMDLLQNPYQLDPGARLEVRVLFDGQPLADRPIWAYNKDGTQIRAAKARTDARRIARFNMEGKGRCLFRLVHLRPCTDHPDVDWQSYWASYTFSLD